MIKKLTLSRRLAMIAAMVSEGNRIADIGTDHGYLPIWLLQSGKVPSAIAADVRSGPLRQAELHLKEAGLEDRMVLRLSDGLSEVAPDEADTITICGMGGPLICRILAEGEETARTAAELILSPQSDLPLVRRFLRTHGFQITDEAMCRDEGKYYTAMKAVYTGETNGSVTEQSDLFGPVLPVRRDPVFLEWLSVRKLQAEKILLQLKDANLNEPEGRNRKRMDEIIRELDVINSLLRRESDV